MAKVEMDLNELKALEAKIAGLETDKQALIDKQMMVVVLHKHYKGKIKVNNGISPTAQSLGVRVTGVQIIERRQHPSSSRYHGYGDPYRSEREFSRTTQQFDEELNLQDAINQGYVDVDITEDTTRTTRDYKNLSEVEEELRGVIGQEYEQRLAEARERATALEYELTAIDNKHVIRLRTLNESNQNELTKIAKEHAAEIKTLTDQKDTEYLHLLAEKDKLQQDYDDLKDDKKRISLEQQLLDLKGELHTLKTRSFWDRVFNK